MKDTAKDLLEDYLYVYNKVMSTPREICKFSYHPKKEKIDNIFCEENCCYPTLEDFKKICKYFKISTENVSWFCCNEKYIKGFDYKNAEYLSRGQQINMRKKRDQIAKYFWLYAYIIKGQKERDDFFNLINDIPTLEDSKFNSLITRFSSITDLSDGGEPLVIYRQIVGEKSSTLSLQRIKDILKPKKTVT